MEVKLRAKVIIAHILLLAFAQVPKKHPIDTNDAVANKKFVWIWN